MIQNGPKWSSMVENNTKWYKFSKMLHKCPTWFKMVKNGPGEQMALCEQKVPISNQNCAKSADFGEINVYKSLRSDQDLFMVNISLGNSLALLRYGCWKLVHL